MSAVVCARLFTIWRGCADTWCGSSAREARSKKEMFVEKGGDGGFCE